MTLAQIEAWTKGHVQAERLAQRQSILAMRAAMTADEADLDRLFADPATPADHAAAEAETMAAFGLSE